MYFSCSQALLRSYKYITRYKTKASLERDILNLILRSRQCIHNATKACITPIFKIVLSYTFTRQVVVWKRILRRDLVYKSIKKNTVKFFFSPFTVSRFFTKTYLDLFCWTLRRSLRSLFTFDFAWKIKLHI